MKKSGRSTQAGLIAALWAALLPIAAIAAPNPAYVTNAVVSNITGVAPHTDSRIINPWGSAFDNSGRLFIAENGAGVITIHNLNGVPTHTSIQVPAPAASINSVGTPTGLAFNFTNGFFIANSNSTKRARSQILFATEDGTIGGWNQSVKATNAIIVIDNSASGAVYKGIDLGAGTNGTFLFAANFGAGVVEKYDTNFGLIQTFTDPVLVSSNYAPFGIKVIQQKLFVTFAKVAAGGHDDEPGAGNGFIDVFNLEGVLVRAFSDQGALNSPWGLGFAPTHFGKFSGDLLVGNFGDGRILAYNIISGEFLGALQDHNGNDLVIPGLWSLNFGRASVDLHYDYEAPNLLFTAGIQSEAAGLIGTVHAVTPFQMPAR